MLAAHPSDQRQRRDSAGRSAATAPGRRCAATAPGGPLASAGRDRPSAAARRAAAAENDKEGMGGLQWFHEMKWADYQWEFKKNILTNLKFGIQAATATIVSSKCNHHHSLSPDQHSRMIYNHSIMRCCP
jgi:hypothetical protein